VAIVFVASGLLASFLFSFDRLNVSGRPEQSDRTTGEGMSDSTKDQGVPGIAVIVPGWRHAVSAGCSSTREAEAGSTQSETFRSWQRRVAEAISTGEDLTGWPGLTSLAGHFFRALDASPLLRWMMRSGWSAVFFREVRFARDRMTESRNSSVVIS